MYDKVKIFCPRTGTTPDVSQYLETAKEQTDLATGETSLYGSVGGLKVCAYASGISVVGSLPKFLYGDNLCPLNLHTTKEAFEKLSDTLQLGLQDAMVTEIEFGANLIMRKPVEVYLRKLGETPRLARCQFTPHTLYYQSKGKQQPKALAFYDKGREVGGDVLEKWNLSQSNVLRYELRLKGRLRKQLKVPEVYVPTLQERDFYRALVDRWQGHYTGIAKARQKADTMDKQMTVKDAFNALVARLISNGGQGVIAEFMDELKAQKAFDDRKNYTRLRQKIAEVAGCGNLSKEDEDVVELDDEIRNTTAYM